MQRQRNIAVLSALFPDLDLFQSEKLLEKYDDDIEKVICVIHDELGIQNDDEDNSNKMNLKEDKPNETQIVEVNGGDGNTLEEPKVTIKGECIGNREITATWIYAQGYSPGENDTIGIYIFNRELNKSFYNSKRVSECLPACTCNFTVRYDGFYELRYFAESLKWISDIPDFTPMCRSERILVGSEVSVRATVEKYCVDVQWDNKTSTVGDWIGIYDKSSRSNKKYVQYKYVEPAHLETPFAIMKFRLPYEEGLYELRYFRKDSTTKLNGYFCSGYSNPFQIRHNDELCYSQNQMILNVSFSSMSVRPSPKDRIEIEDRGTVIGAVECGNYKKRMEEKNVGNVSINLQESNYIKHKGSCKEWTMKFVTGEGKILSSVVLSELRL